MQAFRVSNKIALGDSQIRDMKKCNFIYWNPVYIVNAQNSDASFMELGVEGSYCSYYEAFKYMKGNDQEIEQWIIILLSKLCNDMYTYWQLEERINSWKHNSPIYY